MIGFPFDSQVNYDPEGTPIFDRAISSAPLRQLIKSVLSNGVLPNPSTNLQVQPGTGMSVVVNPGFAVIEGGMKYEESQRTLVVQASDTTYDRIDTVVLRWNDNANARSCDFYIMQGVPASSPVRPALNREGSVYEIGLADLFIVANSSAISAARITDTRYEAERCGIISSIAEFDSDTIYKQVQADLAGFKTEEQEAFLAWFENIKDQLSEDAAGNLQAQIGTRSELETDEKGDLVKAINEVNTKAKNGGKNLVGDEFDEAKTYAVGDYCIYENVLYVFISAKTAGAWDSTLVEATTVADELSEQNKNMEWKYVGSANGKTNINLPSDWTELNLIAVGSATFQFNVPRLHIETNSPQSFHHGFYDGSNWYGYCLINVTKTTAYLDYIKRNGSTETGKLYVYYK